MVFPVLVKGSLLGLLVAWGTPCGAEATGAAAGLGAADAILTMVKDKGLRNH